MSGKRKAAIAFIIIVAIGAAAYLYVHSDYYGDAGPHDITVKINYPEAGTLSTTFGHVEHGDLFSVTVEPNNNGYTFVGWFEGNTKRSTLKTYVFLPKSDTTLTAWFSLDHDASFTATPDVANYPSTVTVTSYRNVEISQRSWVVTDEFTGMELLNTATDGGGDSSFSLSIDTASLLSITQSITYTDGETSTYTSLKVVDDLIMKHFEWRFREDSLYSPITDIFSINNGSIKWDVQLSQTWYNNALNSPLPRDGTIADDKMGNFVTSDDPVIKQMAYELSMFTSKMNDIDRVNCVLKFVQQCFPYQYDIDGKGVIDYYKLPAETLWEGKGDCEDHAFLFASLIKAMGYDVVLYGVECYDQNNVLVSEHMAAGVAVPGGTGYFTTIDGVNYYYCEATFETSVTWYNDANVGYLPTGYVVVKTFAV